MLIFGRATLPAADLLAIVETMLADTAVWSPDTFADAAAEAGLSRVKRTRTGYFTFAAPAGTTGQGTVRGDVIEEIRFFLIREPHSADEDTARQAVPLRRKVYGEYLALFTERFGPSTRKHGNDVFDRVRLLLNQDTIWLVLSQ